MADELLPRVAPCLLTGAGPGEMFLMRREVEARRLTLHGWHCVIG
jgi:hypothetical protein